jgi:hypothetical protein
MWELLTSLLFLAVVYAAIFIRPGHGDVSSIAPGLALYAALSTGKMPVFLTKEKRGRVVY